MSNKEIEFSKFDQQMMKRCLIIAKKASGFTAPNPMVGAVIVKDGKVISEGYHEYFRGPHAEIVAIEKAEESLKGAHIYVNLEPCSHYGNTPPCTLAIIKHGISRVIIATKDPNPLVSGKGIANLKKAGIQVDCGLLEKEALKLNEKFFHFITHKTPFVALKTATSLDGKIATVSGESQWITNEKSREFVHKLRQDYSAILVGINTILNDNPRLNTRLPGEVKHPIKIIADTTLKTPEDFKVMNDSAPLIIATSRMASKTRIKDFEKNKHVKVWICPLINGQIDLKYLFKKLGEEGIDSVLVEGGSTINFSVLENHLAHKIYAFIAPKIIGGVHSKPSFGGKGYRHLPEATQIKNISYQNLDNDIMLEGYF